MRGVPVGSFSLSSVWTTTMTGVADMVPVPTREDATRGGQPLECAWTNHANWYRLVGPRSQT